LFQKGEKALLEKLIHKKLESGKCIDVIASELEMKTEDVSMIIEKMKE